MYDIADVEWRIPFLLRKQRFRSLNSVGDQNFSRFLIYLSIYLFVCLFAFINVYVNVHKLFIRIATSGCLHLWISRYWHWHWTTWVFQLKVPQTDENHEKSREQLVFFFICFCVSLWQDLQRENWSREAPRYHHIIILRNLKVCQLKNNHNCWTRHIGRRLCSVKQGERLWW